MGNYLNPGNENFGEIVNDQYTDKTGLIEIINNSINRSNRLICVSRPRRFGKSYAAQMLCAYYDKTCDSHKVFEGLEISYRDSYGEHINKYDVIYIDMTAVIGETDINELVPYIKRSLIDEITELYPDVEVKESFAATLINTVKSAGNKLIAIIDEWDAPIREAGSDSVLLKEYLDFLRLLFKNSGVTNKVFAAAYMTGILPIKKDGSQSAISNFNEYSVLDPMQFSGYFGFKENEVIELCKKYSRDFDLVKKWYDGYSFGEYYSVYNPYSVMCAMESGKYKSYWKKTTAAEALTTYINMNFDGLQEDIIRLIAGEAIEVHTEDFANDVETFHSREDVLTLMIHLGYLAYDEANNEVRIPNEEVREEFNSLIRKADMNKLAELIRKSDNLLADTIACDEDSVAASIERIRESNYAPNFYNDEQALRYVIKFAYIVCVDKYMKIEELPSGRGIADVVFLPKKNTDYPAMVIELKWDKTDEAAIAQIKDRKYPTVLKDYGGEILLVGINYDSKSKQHSCKIEKIG